MEHLAKEVKWVDLTHEQEHKFFMAMARALAKKAMFKELRRQLNDYAEGYTTQGVLPETEAPDDLDIGDERPDDSGCWSDGSAGHAGERS